MGIRDGDNGESGPRSNAKTYVHLSENWMKMIWNFGYLLHSDRALHLLPRRVASYWPDDCDEHTREHR